MNDTLGRITDHQLAHLLWRRIAHSLGIDELYSNLTVEAQRDIEKMASGLRRDIARMAAGTFRP